MALIRSPHASTARGRAREALIDVATSQGGFFTAAQARDAGYTPQDAYYHSAVAGDWLRSLHGVYRLTWWPAGPAEEEVRWTLWSGGEGVVSHDSAAHHHHLGDLEPQAVHLTVPLRFRRRTPNLDALPGDAGRVLPVLHPAVLDPGDVTFGSGFRVTTPLRTVLDLAATPIDVEHLAAVVRDALANGVVTHAGLTSALRSAESSATVDRFSAALDEAVTMLSLRGARGG